MSFPVRHVNGVYLTGDVLPYVFSVVALLWVKGS